MCPWTPSCRDPRACMLQTPQDCDVAAAAAAVACPGEHVVARMGTPGAIPEMQRKVIGSMAHSSSPRQPASAPVDTRVYPAQLHRKQPLLCRNGMVPTALTGSHACSRAGLSNISISISSFSALGRSRYRMWWQYLPENPSCCAQHGPL